MLTLFLFGAALLALAVLVTTMDSVDWYKVRNFPNRLRGWKQELWHWLGVGNDAELQATIFRGDGEHYLRNDPRLKGVAGSEFRRLLRLRGFVQLENDSWYGPDCSQLALGTVSRRVVTNDGVAFIVDAFQNLVELEAMNAHGMGTGNTAEAAGDTALVTEVETRQSGTQSEPSSNQYRSTATLTATATRAIVEHGLFNSTTVSGSKLFDRSVFSTINLSNGDSIQFQYTLTVSAGG